MGRATCTQRRTWGLARLGYRVTGIDIAANMIEQAQRNCTVLGLQDAARFEVGDFSVLEKRQETFDAILGLGFVEYFDSAQEVLRKMAALTKPGGHLIVQIWNCKPLPNLFELPIDASYRAVRSPIRQLREFARTRVPLRVHRLIRRNANSSVSGDVEHKRYSPREFESIAMNVGLRVVGARGSKYFLGRSVLAEGARKRMETWIQRRAGARPWLMRRATDYVLALRVPGTKP